MGCLARAPAPPPAVPPSPTPGELRGQCGVQAPGLAALLCLGAHATLLSHLARAHAGALLAGAAHMWGAILGIAGASVALAVLHQAVEYGAKAQQAEKQGALPEPGPDFKKAPGARRRAAAALFRALPGARVAAGSGRPPGTPARAPAPCCADGQWKAPLWESTSAREALNKAKRAVRK